MTLEDSRRPLIPPAISTGCNLTTLAAEDDKNNEAKNAAEINDVQPESSSPSPPESADVSESAKVSFASFPNTIKFIVGNEFCERFSYYGMRAILALYLHEQLHMEQSRATEFVHLFIVAAYIAPLIGAFISDSYLGKYTTILSLSLLYCLGNFLVSFSAVISADHAPDHVTAAFKWAAAGLGFLALGSGGIKPCVSAFGGDQIELTQPPGKARDALIRSFFSAFYFAINVGASLSTVITPLLRADVSYATAFALPAFLMVTATFIFWLGSRDYVHQPPGGNVVTEVISVAFSAVKRGREAKARQRRMEANLRATGSESALNETDVESALLHSTSSDVASLKRPPSMRRLSKRGSKRAILPPGFKPHPHWLDPAKAEHEDQTVEDVKQLLRVLWLFVPVPIFWSLYDQQASRWIFQAARMDGRLPFGIVVQPDQLQTVNSVLILVMIPLFDQLIYPWAERVGFSIRPINRMVLGMTVGAFSFVMSAGLQSWIERTALQGSSPLEPHSPGYFNQATFVSGKALVGPFSVGYSHGLNATAANSTGALSLAGPTPLASSAVYESICGKEGSPPCLSMMWQVPQYVVLTAAEILFSITGLELAFSQAPATMTSVVSAAWSLTTALGNLFTVVVVGTISPLLTQTQEFLFFASLCALSSFLLKWAGSGFTYVESAPDVAEGGADETNGENGSSSSSSYDASSVEQQQLHNTKVVVRCMSNLAPAPPPLKPSQ